MLELLNTKIFDNERNILNADLFVNNLKPTFKAFKFNTKITYEVYRNITIYHITWNDDKSYEDMLELKKEIALALGVTTNEFEIEKEKENEVKIKVQNLLEVGATMNIHIIMSTDSVLDEDINYLFDKDDISKLSFYLTTRREYNKFLDNYIDESLGRDGIYVSTNSTLTRISLPLIEDDEITRVVDNLEVNI